MSPESEALKAMRPAFLALFKAANERYFARQMGMTVPEWREAQAGGMPSRGNRTLFWKIWAALSIPAMVLYWRSFG